MPTSTCLPGAPARPSQLEKEPIHTCLAKCDSPDVWGKRSVRRTRSLLAMRVRSHIVGSLLVGLATLLMLAGCASGSYGEPSNSDPGRNGFYGGDGDDLDCSDVGGPVAVPGADPNNLDADNDGVGCEG